MRSRGKLLSRAAVGIAVILTTGALSFPASAAPAAPMAAPSGCGAHALCLYQNINYNASGGTLWQYVYGTVPANTWEYVGAAANDQTSSWYNNRVWDMEIAQNSPPGSGHTACYPGPEGNADLTSTYWAYPTSMNDSISSYALINGDTCPL